MCFFCFCIPPPSRSLTPGTAGPNLFLDSLISLQTVPLFLCKSPGRTLQCVYGRKRPLQGLLRLPLPLFSPGDPFLAQGAFGRPGCCAYVEARSPFTLDRFFPLSGKHSAGRARFSSAASASFEAVGSSVRRSLLSSSPFFRGWLDFAPCGFFLPFFQGRPPAVVSWNFGDSLPLDSSENPPRRCGHVSSSSAGVFVFLLGKVESFFPFLFGGHPLAPCCP